MSTDRLAERIDEFLRANGQLAKACAHTKDEFLRDAVIQRFEFTYELSHKMLKRFLESTSPSPANIDEMAFQDLIRTGNEQFPILHRNAGMSFFRSTSRSPEKTSAWW